MAASASNQPSNFLWTFTTLNIKNRNFGYVDRHFAVAYADELSDKWMCVDSNGQLHKLRYNQDPRSPRLTKGWAKLRTTFNIQGNVHVQLRYLGSNQFEITVFTGNCSDLSMDRYLHLATTENDNYIHCVKLTNEQATGDHLDLKGDITGLIRNKNIQNLMLVGLKTVVTCKILNLEASYATRILDGWKEFCIDHGLKEGDLVFFEMEMAGDDEDVEVFVNECMCDFYPSYKPIVIDSP